MCEELVSHVSSSSSLLVFLVFLTLIMATLSFPSVLLLIWSLIREFSGETTTITGWNGDSVCVDRVHSVKEKSR